MERITDATGGRLLHPEIPEDVERSYSQLRNDLLSQYWVTLAPPGKARKFHYLGGGGRTSLSALGRLEAGVSGEGSRFCLTERTIGLERLP